MNKIRYMAAGLAAFFLLSGLPVMSASAQGPCDPEPSIKIKLKVYLEGALSSLGMLKADAQDLNPGTQFRDCRECPLMAVVPAGSFRMGSPDSEPIREVDEQPVHSVTITKTFAVGVCEVTFDEYDACVKAGGCMHTPNDQGWGKETRPVVDVSWDDAKEYVAWLSKRTREQYRLLTEAEWEYAARAGTTTTYSFGSAITTDDANYANNAFNQTTPVGSYKPNDFGLYDVHGNVAEWTEDCWHISYDGNGDGEVKDPGDAPTDGSAWADSEDCVRVVRGGSWINAALNLRSAARDGLDADRRGIRVAKTLTQ